MTVYFISTDGITLSNDLIEDTIARVCSIDGHWCLITKDYEAQLFISEFNKSWSWNKELMEERIKSYENSY